MAENDNAPATLDDVLNGLRATFEQVAVLRDEVAAVKAAVDELKAAPVRGGGGGFGGGGGGKGGKGASGKQLAMMKGKAEEAGMDGPTLLAFIKDTTGWAPESIDQLDQLSGYKASQTIDALLERVGGGGGEGGAAQPTPPPPNDADVPF